MARLYFYSFTTGDQRFIQLPKKHASGHIMAEEWRDAVPKLRTGNEEFYRMYTGAGRRQGRQTESRGAGEVFVPLAEVFPWFMAPFGRDSLISSLQNVIVWPEFAKGALDYARPLAGDHAHDPLA